MLPDQFLEKISSDKSMSHLDIDLITRALRFAEKYHEGQYRKSGEPYIVHPISVAYELSKHGFDSYMVAASLLHDVIEDCDVIEDDLNKEFGSYITKLVQGTTKLNKFSFPSYEESQLNNLRKFILAISEDVRVLIIKLFDRLDNMRSIHYITKEEKKRRIAQETLDIYAPLAQRISLHDVKEEMETISFNILEPKVVKYINSETKNILENYKDLSTDIIKEVTCLLKRNNIEDFSITGRTKKPYSIWKKMVRKSCAFYDITDIVAFRIVVNSKSDCYKVLYLLHDSYKSVMGRFKDYISSPKGNNYRSLHTGVFFKNNQQIEFQIRDKEMQAHAENGIASHWKYKDNIGNISDIRNYDWLRKIVEVLSTSDIATADIYNYSKMQVFEDEVFVFTTKGEIIHLPRDSCVIDFAYAIHSSLGNICTGALIDGVYSSIFTKLENAQTVDIITNQNQEPKYSWLSFVKTGVAKAFIKKHLNYKDKQNKREYVYNILNYSFQKEGVNFNKSLIPEIGKLFNINSEDDLFKMIIEGELTADDIIEKILPKNKQYFDTDIDNLVIINANVEYKAVRFAKCCFIVQKDPVIGFLLPHKAIEIHHSSCSIVKSIIYDLPYVDVSWNPSSSNIDVDYICKLKIQSSGENDCLSKINNVIYDNGYEVISCLMNDSKEGIIFFKIKIKGQQELKKLICSLNKLDDVFDVVRVIN